VKIQEGIVLKINGVTRKKKKKKKYDAGKSWNMMGG